MDARGLGLRLALALVAPLVALNLAVALLGGTRVFPLSPFHLEDKARALWLYAKHRPRCLFRGHPDLGAHVARAEARHGLPRGLLAALVEVESEAEAHRISFAGAMGPGQLMPGTAELLEVEDPYDPEEALDASARYLAAQVRHFDVVALAVAAYNAGPGNVKGRVPRNGETEHYVPKVLAAYRRLRPPTPPRPAPTPVKVAIGKGKKLEAPVAAAKKKAPPRAAKKAPVVRSSETRASR